MHVNGGKHKTAELATWYRHNAKFQLDFQTLPDSTLVTLWWSHFNTVYKHASRGILVSLDKLLSTVRNCFVVHILWMPDSVVKPCKKHHYVRSALCKAIYKPEAKWRQLLPEHSTFVLNFCWTSGSWPNCRELSKNILSLWPRFKFLNQSNDSRLSFERGLYLCMRKNMWGVPG